MPCMSDVILIELLSVLISIYHFGKIIFTEQAGLPSLPKEKRKVGENTLKGLLSRCYFCLTSCSIVGMTEFASLILFLLFLCPLKSLKATPEDANIAFTNVEKYPLFTSFVVHIGLPKGQSRPFFSLLSFLRGLVSLTQGLEDI